MKYCKKCGSELKENAKFCGKCGQLVGTPSQPAKPRQQYHCRKYALIPAVILVAFLLLLLWGTPGYEKPVALMVKAMNEEDTDYLRKSLPVKSMAEDSKIKLEDIEDEFYTRIGVFEKTYGPGWRMDYKLLDREALGEKERKALQRQYDDLKLRDANIEKGFRTVIKLTVKGKKDSETIVRSINIVKVNGAWSLDLTGLKSLSEDTKQ